jgi:hypothetical protein
MERQEYPAHEGLQVVLNTGSEPAHEGLQVVPNTGSEPAHEGLQVVPNTGSEPAHEGLQVVPSDGLETRTAATQPNIDNKETHLGSPPAGQKGQPKVCGIRRRTFAIIIGIVIALAIVGAVVGGVVGSRHSTSNKE